MRILVIDNYDSFTFNLVQALGALGHELLVYRNDQAGVAQLAALHPRRIIISPGPGRPETAGISGNIIRELGHSIWTLGVCLGHQSIGHAFGAPVRRAPDIVHGKTSWVLHDGRDLHAGLPNPFQAMRYHSLCLPEEELPDCLEVTARAMDGTVMGIRHRTWKLLGVQYHPESFLTPDGVTVLKNFLELPE